MTRFTTIFMVLALVCVTAFGCGEESTTAPPDDDDPTTGTIVVDRSPNTLSCTWTMTGPGSFSHNGTGDERIEDLDPGDYTLTWTEMAGWNCPSPQSETKAVPAGGTTTFTGTYVQQEGSITVNPEPDAINAPWTLTGPSSYSHSGTGDETLTGLDIGSYTITWEVVTDWDLPDPATETLSLADGGSLTFTGTYTEQTASTGTVRVQPQNATDAPWHIDGPSSYSYDGTGYEELTDMEAGDYTVTWGEVSGYTTPGPTDGTLAEGGNLLLQGPYTPQVSYLYVDANPDAIDAPWHIDGPGGWSYDNTGDRTLGDRPWGEYTITWGEVSGWNLPDPPTETMTLDATLWQTFTGNYTQAWTPNMLFIAGGKFEMGSPVTELGRSDNETQHWVQVSSFHMCESEITHSQYQSVVPEHSYGPGYENRALQVISRMDWMKFCNALSVKEGLTPCYTIIGTDNAGADVTCDWNANGYRLPTEAEWEYACRAGATTAFANGEITNELCDDPVLDVIARYCGNDPSLTYEVMTKIPNAWGLYDMHGNAKEIIWDRYGDYGTGTFENPDIDPTGPATGSNYLYRDYGSGQARSCRAAYRGWTSSGYIYGGCRLVRNAD